MSAVVSWARSGWEHANVLLGAPMNASASPPESDPDSPDGTGWSDNVRVPGQKSKAACALASHDAPLHMVHLGDSSNDIWHTVWDGTGWSDNVRVPGQKSKAACALAFHDRLLHMVHLGDSSNDIWHTVWGRHWLVREPEDPWSEEQGRVCAGVP